MHFNQTSPSEPHSEVVRPTFTGKFGRNLFSNRFENGGMGLTQGKVKYGPRNFTRYIGLPLQVSVLLENAVTQNYFILLSIKPERLSGDES